MVVGTINPYTYTERGCHQPEKNDHPRIGQKKFTFRDKQRLRYIVEVEIYTNDVYAVKFFVKNHSGSPFRYNNLTGNGDARRIIDTCLQIAIDLYKANDQISFCFIGAPTQKEFQETGYNNTKRFRVYSLISKFLINPETFTHTEVTESSFYVLLNNNGLKKNPNLFETIRKMFNDNYDLRNFFPDLEQIRKHQLSRSTGAPSRRR